MNFECLILNYFRFDMKTKPNVIQEKSFNFSLRIIHLCKSLKEIREFDISRQLFRSGTSIGANVEEALAAHSRKDFLYKMGIASRESRETSYWLRLIKNGNILKVPDDYFSDINEITSILTAIVKTTSQSLK